MPCVHDGHRQRQLEKFKKHGFSVFAEHEKLELILYFSVPRHDTNEIAHKLLQRFGSISAVMDAPAEMLTEFPHITERTVQLFEMIKATAALYESDKKRVQTHLKSTDEYATYFQLYFANVKDERLAVMSLNNNGKFLGCEFVCEGDIESVGVSTRKIVEKVIETRATAVVICHNHPGGIALPSAADVYVTKQIKVALDSVGVGFLDHIILSGNDYVSMATSKAYIDIFA